MREGNNSLYDILSSAQENRIRIPVYQRPYEWEADKQVDTLVTDLKEAYEEYTRNADDNRRYFLGNIIACKEEDANGAYATMNLIDGQQRITTLMLLLRAMLPNIDDQLPVHHRIERTLWRISADDTENPNYDSPNLVADENYIVGFYAFSHIMETGQPNSETQYDLNYLYLCEQVRDICEEYADRNNRGERGVSISRFARFILERTVLNVFLTADLDDAFETFRVLNSKGLPLTDSDVFKASILARIEPQNRLQFLRSWKQLYSDSEDYIKDGIDVLFTAYMEYIHALGPNGNQKYPKLKTFFEYNNYERLTPREGQPDIMEHLQSALNFYKYAEKRHLDIFENEAWSRNIDIQKIFDVLRYVPVRTWISPWIYYRRWHENPDFEEMYLYFLRKYSATVMVSYINKPGEKSIANQRPALNVAILHSRNGNIDFANVGFEYANIENYFDERIMENIKPTYVKPLLAMLAYLEIGQNDLLPESWEIEHIVPKKVDTAILFSEQNGDNFDRDNGQFIDIKPYIERLGNKMPLIKKLNIPASNHYFADKQRKYIDSSIVMSRNMSRQNPADWQNAVNASRTIEARERNMVEMLRNALRAWQQA